MSKRLYVVNYEQINNLKKNFPARDIVSIAWIFNSAPSIDEIDNLCDEIINNCMIDITALATDNAYNGIFVERYLYTLIERFKDIVFLINALKKDLLLDKFPYVFNEINKDYSDGVNYSKKENIINELNVKPISLLVYQETLCENIIQEHNVISIGCLFSLTDNLNYRFNTEEVENVLVEKNIQYIDISQIVHTLAIRKDLLLTFEVILKQIKNINEDIHFLISDDLKNEFKRCLPFSFRYKDYLNSQFVGHESKPIENKLSLDGISQNMIENFGARLRGHKDFKKDFKFNLQKFTLLNKLKERKIFSVFLTGESGIGKTEFAKILSETLYPNQALIKINFGNYSNEGVLNSLIGAPLGYIGSEEGGELINKIRESKSKVILIDEFEKASSSVFHFFYELLDDGKFTDRHGVEHHLDGYIIVFTSNMSKERFIDLIPDPLKSRFDMVYRFMELSFDEKRQFIDNIARELIQKIGINNSVLIDMNNIANTLNILAEYSNLRVIKRKVEDVVIEEYYRIINNE